MDAIEEKYDQFTDILSEEELKRLSERYQTADQRERKLPIRVFFWMMVLSAGQPKARGALFQMVAFFVGALSGLFALKGVLTLTRMALSLKLKQTDWISSVGSTIVCWNSMRRSCPPLNGSCSTASRKFSFSMRQLLGYTRPF